MEKVLENYPLVRVGTLSQNTAREGHCRVTSLNQLGKSVQGKYMSIFMCLYGQESVERTHVLWLKCAEPAFSDHMDLNLPGIFRVFVIVDKLKLILNCIYIYHL